MIKYILIFILLIFISCQTSNTVKKTNNRSRFYYQLQNYGKKFENDIVKSKNDIWVIDSYKKSDVAFTPFEVLNYTQNNNLIFSYLSIGEAENYRKYFKTIKKDLVLYSNPNWKNNFIIKYWDPQWESILKQRLKNILDQGFQGVFFDVIDVYQRFKHKDAAKQMAELIINLSKFSKNINQKFSINMQNGFEIISKLDKTTQVRLMNAINGLSVEAHYYDYRNNKIIKNKWFYETEAILEEYKKKNKTIYMIEYTQNKEHQKELIHYCSKNKINLLITDKNLTGKFFIHER